ncbi:MAG: 1-acyl-sn-glycerol-3-phosphate acyltransferase, partial [Clostridia bacterium]|nr:1-acyl-sn-glycerol-3-phosphate acyltransferase [Clostridia bacterium]
MTVQTEPKKPAVKKKKWTLPRHRIVTNLARPIVRLLCKLRYNCDVVPFAEQGDRQYLILANHQTPFDQFYIASAFKNAVYYIATEDIFSLGWVSDIIRFLVNPIAIRKQMGDVKAVMNCIRVAREGGTIALFPEGNRTYSGRTEYMSPSIVGLAKKLGLPIAIFRIEGGYGIEPRWSDVRRKGRMTAYVKEVIEPEEYKNMDDDTFYTRITEALHVDEGCVSGTFPHKERAQYLERAVYVCPHCGLSTFESHEDIVE